MHVSKQLIDAVVKYYCCEPCRICGQMQSADDAATSIYVGYSRDERSRTAHLLCMDSFIPQTQWVLK